MSGLAKKKDIIDFTKYRRLAQSNDTRINEEFVMELTGKFVAYLSNQVNNSNNDDNNVYIEKLEKENKILRECKIKCVSYR